MSKKLKPQKLLHKVTPNGSTMWIPHCDLDKKPIVGMTFKNLEKPVDFYSKYA